MNLRLPSLAALLVLVGCGYPNHWIEKTERYEFDAAVVERLRCETHNGRIRVAEDPAAAKVVVVAEIRAGGADLADAEAALDAIEMVCGVESGELVLGWEWRDEHSRWGAEVRFDVVLPAAVPTRAVSHNGDIDIVARGECVAESHNGDIEIGGVVARVSAQTHNGTLVVTAPVQQIDAVSHNGTVRVTGTADGRIDGRIETYNGGVVLELAPETDTRLDCSTANGSVHCSVSVRTVESGDGYLIGELGAASGRLEVSTHNGSITVRSGAGSTPR